MMGRWIEKDERPISGSLVQLITEAGATKLVIA